MNTPKISSIETTRTGTRFLLTALLSAGIALGGCGDKKDAAGVAPTTTAGCAEAPAPAPQKKLRPEDESCRDVSIPAAQHALAQR